MANATASGELQAHYDKANQLAVSIFCQTQALIPPILQEETNKQILMQTTEFALHARRTWELSKIKIPSGKMGFLTRYSSPEISKLDICDDYFDSIGILMHAQDIKINYITINAGQLFSDCENLSVAFIEARTDKRPTKNISLIGISWFFLTVIRGEIVEKYKKS